MTTDLKSLVLDFLKNELIMPCRTSSADYVVMVTDDSTLKVISSIASIHEINEAGVGVVLNISFERDRLNVPAIYFMDPTKENIRLLKADFSKKIPTYKSAHIYFNGHLGDDLLEEMKDCKVLIEKLQTLKELDLNFLLFESNVFSFNMDTISSVFRDENKNNPVLEEIAGKLASLCVTVKEYPYVRYDRNCQIGEKLAKLLDKNINDKIRKLPNWKYNENRSTLLIASRAKDPVAPLMHEYSFKAMAADLFTYDGKFMEIDKDGKKEKFLMSDDQIWPRFANKHIAEVISELPAQSKKFLEENPLLRIKKSTKKNVKEMMKAVRNAPQYKKEADSYNKNIAIAEACMKVFKEGSLKEISEFEQDLATGLDSKGNKCKGKYFKNKLTELLQKSEISKFDKKRLCFIYKASVTSKNKWFPVEASDALDDTFSKQELLTIEKIGIFCGPKEKTAEELKRNKKHAEKTTLTLNRFLPHLEESLANLSGNKLSSEAFPFVKEPPPEIDDNTSKRRRRNKKDSKNSPKLIVFVIGGLTFSEIKSASLFSHSKDREIFIGGTKILTPKAYVAELSNL